MRETGEPFEVEALDGSDDRFTLRPVEKPRPPARSRGKLVAQPESDWEYHVVGRPLCYVVSAEKPRRGDRPAAFTLLLRDEQPHRHLPVKTVEGGD